MSSPDTPQTSRQKLFYTLFDHHSKRGHQVEIIITWLIILSVITVILESVHVLDDAHEEMFYLVEWVFTIIFTIEYILRIYIARRRWHYITSFFGIVDLLSILPAYIGIFIPGNQQLLIVRVLRLLRMFRIFKMGHFVNEGAIVASALRASKRKIIVFLSFVGITSVLLGALMYMVEEGVNPNIRNIPEGIYWAIVTVTTVGYGDTVPVTVIGKALAVMTMIMGYGIIAIPTGIVTAEITNRVLSPRGRDGQLCPRCGNDDHLKKANYCHHCGELL